MKKILYILLFFSLGVQGQVAFISGGTGTNVVIDGGFNAACGVNWTCGSNWSIAGGKLVGAATTAATFQNTVENGKTYEATYTISDYSGGNVRIQIGNTNGTFRGANGTYKEIIISAGTGVLFDGGSAFTGKIDNVIVIEQ